MKFMNFHSFSMKSNGIMHFQDFPILPNPAPGYRVGRGVGRGVGLGVGIRVGT